MFAYVGYELNIKNYVSFMGGLTFLDDRITQKFNYENTQQIFNGNLKKN